MVEPAPAPLAVISRTRADLAARLAAWPGNDGDMTWGLVVLSVVPTAGELAAAREAGRLCDRVVGVRLPADAKLEAPLSPNFAEVVRAAGVDIAFVPKDLAGPIKVDLGVEQGVGANPVLATLLVQTVLAVLPTLVVASRADLHTVRALRNLQAGFGDVFTLRLV